MASLDINESAKVELRPQDVLRVTVTGGSASVTGLSGAPSTTTTVTGTRDFGPYNTPAVVRVLVTAGRADYGVVDTTGALTATEAASVRALVSGAGNPASPITTPFLFAGSATTAAPQASAPLTGIGAIATVAVTAGAGVTGLTCQVQATNDAATAAGSGSAWTTIATINLSAAGTAQLPLAFGYVGLRANVTTLSGGTAAVSVSAGQVPLTNGAGNMVVNAALTGVPVATPFVAYQSAVPVMLPPSGTMGNNGAITLGTALPVVIPACWMWLPANAIFTGSAAGIYFVQMSSTTVGQVFNNTLSSGVPYIPVSPAAFASTGPGAYTSQAYVATNLVTLPILGGSMGPTGILTRRAIWMRPSNGNVYGPSEWLGGVALGTNPVANQLWVGTEKTLRNTGAQNRQVGLNSATNLQTDNGAYGNAAAFFSIDTSANQNFNFQTACAAADYMILAGFDVVVSPGA
jgi:hypothetical protein